MMKSALRLLIAAAVMPAFAQQIQMPTASDVAAKKLEMMQAVNAAGPSGHAVQQELKSNRAAVAAMGGQVQPGQTAASKQDFLSLARPMAPRQPQGADGERGKSDLMIFVSLSMPEGMLRNYAAQAKRFGGVLVLRGFVDDKLSATREALVRLNQAGVQWDISPEPFKTFKIDKVPAIVLASADASSVLEDGCAHPQTYTSIFGDMSVYDALDKMALRAQPAIAQMAKAKLIKDRQDARSQ